MQESLLDINIHGLATGLATFMIIGLFHPLVIKGEYWLGQTCKWLFLLAGIIMAVFCVLVKDYFVSALLGVAAFSSFWSIKEVADQKKRVEKGWFPDNPDKLHFKFRSFFRLWKKI